MVFDRQFESLTSKPFKGNSFKMKKFLFTISISLPHLQSMACLCGRKWVDLVLTGTLFYLNNASKMTNAVLF